MSQKEIQQKFQQQMDEKELLNCMRCGFCLPSCPTYIESGQQETHSPRGRIALMKAVRDGIIEPDEDVEHSLNLCLGCRACEPVCPSGVKYGRLLEDARDIIQQHKPQSLPVKLMRRMVFKGLFPSQSRMRKAAGLLRFYQTSGLQTAARKTRMLKVLPSHLQLMEQALPKVPPQKKNRLKKYKAIGPVKKRVAFFSGCLMDTVFSSTNKATIQLLQLAGCDVIVPPIQTCCGALHGHSGEKDQAKQLAKRNIEAFEETDAEAIVMNAGGCGAFLSDYGHLLKDDPAFQKRSEAFSQKITDISTILVELKFHRHAPLALPEQVITYQDSCHLRNGMGVDKAPRVLMKAIEGVTLKEMKHADRCCGSAGIYNILQPKMSMQILDHKMMEANQTAATAIVTSNPGCQLQMAAGVKKSGHAHDMRAVHLADFLLEAVQYGKKASSS
ncbi:MULTISPECIES: (Fe-S)-binding protein [Bacillus]|uniref:Glycolate oxidase iron-sulfur subunit n=1 Tax=Bacillus xiamenensis TaxID=1178537 RepID=A0ABT4F699_9BACI|nr:MULTISPECIES: (Fe-S)-binding protein [Bacillus]EKF34468.1 (S)-2-hydroxy-acid oxidase subunit F [Bacillus xiamenensis]MBG9912819.1 glycolate oxidase [Bacillus xiamenensis]MCW1836160.1 (Fe-S)-binding protein [Bacillus xiamenensis]MCY9577564.1 (Fe-S)-binding protein [Bacillus xiamenensis]QGX65854.1 4Fe-4S dicluster domain-containing protein [Bacillus sp. ms-22]